MSTSQWIIAVLFSIYISGFLGYMLIGMTSNALPREYDDPVSALVWPIVLGIVLYKLISKFLNQFKLNQMNFKVLGKAMGFMFLPTLGILLVLLIGFFDPIAMWNFIKSDNGWAILIRVILFLAEVALVIVMYDHYLKEEIKSKLLDSNTKKYDVSDCEYTKNLFSDRADDRHYDFYKHTTEHPNMIIVERIAKTN